MKKQLFTLTLFLLAFTFAAKANPVDLQTAQEVGLRFMNANTTMLLRGTNDLQLAKTYSTESGEAAFYIFNVPSGYVIVAADDCAHPVLGYSDAGQFDAEDIPVNMEEYLQGFVDQIAYGVENHLSDPEIAEQWQLVQTTGRVTENRSTTVVEPLLTDSWGQSSPYNLYCPYDEDQGYRTVVGCVATSMAQIMHYWGYPAYGSGSMTYHDHYPEQTVNFGETRYDWANMVDDLNSGADSTQIKAVATLMWHCGVSVQISYGVGATAGSSEKVGDALVDYFYYSPDLYSEYRYLHSDEEWLGMLKTCLNQSRPIHYSGGNHAFVCDGYDANDFLHFNWGWDGGLNGYFQLGALTPGYYDFNNYNYAIFDIHPNCTNGTNYQVTTSAIFSGAGTLIGGGTYSCGDGCSVIATPAPGYRFCSWTENGEVISTNPTYNFTVINNRNLVANFVEDYEEYCTLVFDFYDSYYQTIGNGWNGNYLTVNYSDGCFASEQLTLKNGCSTTLKRTVPEGTHVVLGWISGQSTSECYFSISYEDGPVICEGYNMNSDYAFEFDVDCDGSTPKYYDIAALANPAEGGTVNGIGSYLGGTECTLTATANEGYTFVNWTCIGEVLSTEATYSFTASKSRNVVANFVRSNANIVDGVLSGVFSVSDSLQVNFSQGNLQYIGSADSAYWKFAEHQWDYLGEEGNSNLGRMSHKANRDLFGWGCSGYNHGNYPYSISIGLKPYQPWTFLPNYRWYQAYANAMYNLDDQNGQADWGFNAIVNGGNMEGRWRTLSSEEWQYLLYNREGANEKRGMATVSGIQGMVLLPDTWSLPDGCTFTSDNGYSDNNYGVSQWALMEANGAVFLPAAGRRDECAFNGVGASGNYWSSSQSTNYWAFQMGFGNGVSIDYGYRYRGNSVRLVRSTPNNSYEITATPNPVEGGSVTGMGTFLKGQYCILTAIPNEGYMFVNWTEDGEVVSTDPQFIFKVTKGHEVFANYISDSNNTGVLKGVFSVSDSLRVRFSQGNLQYQASNNIWRFADHQWDYVGGSRYGTNYGTVYENGVQCDNTMISSTYSGWIDLFGWGTSGYDHGAVCYQPWSTNNNNSDYYAYGDITNNLYDQDGKADWGYNPIINGGNIANSWRTLTKEELDYLFEDRITPSGIRYAKGQVNEVKGLIVLPDDWSADYYDLVKPNVSYGNGASFDNNVIPLETWTAVFEAHGAVFLPAASYRSKNQSSVYYNASNTGYYWSSSVDNNNAATLYFNDNYFTPNDNDLRYYGFSVRLVRSAGNYCGITASANSSEAGTVNGGGAFLPGAECVLTATANDGFVFVNWTKDGEVVSTNPTYSFTVTGNQHLVATFYGTTNIGINAAANPAEAGTVTGAGDYLKYQTCNLTATANDGYVFANWTEDNEVVSNSSTYSFIVTDNRVLSANFINIENLIHINACSNPMEGGTIAGAGDYLPGASCVLTAIANKGYAFQNWTENGEVVSADHTYSFTVAENRDLEAHFIQICFDGAFNSGFSVSSSRVVWFSQGNLQYQASTNTWRFAENQWDHVGNDNTNISPTYDGWIDLFGWGTSGYDHGAVCYQPWSISQNNSDYYAYGDISSSLYDQDGRADWGFNAISNGGNIRDKWRTLTKDEWNYLIWTRNTESGIRFARAQVNGMDGIILLPDNWSSDYYALVNPNTYSQPSSFTNNIIDETAWLEDFEAHGAVFLPASYSRLGYLYTGNSTIGRNANYWSSFVSDGETYVLNFGSAQIVVYETEYRSQGNSVRLVCDVFSINAIPNLENGGTVTGEGSYLRQDECTLTATASEGFVFANWTKDGEVVSTSSTYSFTVTESQQLVANFYGSSCTVNVTTNLPEGGTVAGGGSYLQGQTCVVTASANEGYRFVCWMENDSVVSMDTIYCFIVGSNQELVAHFASFQFNSQGALYGAFSVSVDQQVHFSQGNLQYQASTNTWQFAANQYDCIGSGNANISSTYDGWIDLFGWGTSGYNHGAVCYQPWSTSMNESDYYAYGDDCANLYDQTGQADWGYNAISNSGDGTNLWRTLSGDEWLYLLQTRNTSSGIRFAKAQVNGENGLVLLPDDWSNDYYSLINPNLFYSSASSYNDNQIDLATWTDNLEAHGAVFLPASDRRYGSYCNANNSYGYYWSSTTFNYNDDVTRAYSLYFGDSYIARTTIYKDYGSSVRLVCSAHTISTSANPVEGGTINGGGLCIEGTECTLSATAKPGYAFLNWTRDGEVVSTSATYSFTVTEDADFVANFVETENITQTSPFGQGWNWWSSYVVADDLMVQMKTALGADGKQIKSQSKFTMNYGTMWMGQLNSLENDQTYMIQANNACSVELTGAPVNPADYPITLTTGWKWIGYPCTESMSVSEALAGITPSAGDQIKAQNNFATYYNNIGWMGSLRTLTPGAGYMYKLNGASQTLVFPNGGRGELAANVTAEGNHWTPEVHAYPSNMTVMAVVELEGTELRSENYELAAFANGEVRGSAKLMYVEPLDRYMAFLTIAGDEAAELRFGLYDGMDEYLDSDDFIVYATDAIVGSFSEPLVVRFRETTGLSENESSLFVYPNPVADKLNVKATAGGRIEVYSVIGELVYSKDGCAAHTELSVRTLPAGTYVIRMISDDSVQITRFVKE